jgi:hypothetical protein
MSDTISLPQAHAEWTSTQRGAARAAMRLAIKDDELAIHENDIHADIVLERIWNAVVAADAT